MTMWTVLSFFFFLWIHSTDSLVYNDRISTSVQITHARWRTPYVELSINEMPKFLKSEIIQIKPILPSEEDGTKQIWNPNFDIKMSMTFAESKLVINPFLVYKAKDNLYLEKLILLFEHDGYELIKVGSKISYAPFNSSYPIPYTIEYKWRGTKDEDRPLGVITLFLISIVLFIGILAVIYTTYDRDQPIPIKRTPGSGSGSSSMYSSGAGIHVKRRPSGGSDKKARY